MIVILLALMSSIVLVDGEELSDEQCREIGYNRNELWCDSCVELEKFEPNLKESCMKCCKENVHAKNKVSLLQCFKVFWLIIFVLILS